MKTFMFSIVKKILSALLLYIVNPCTLSGNASCEVPSVYKRVASKLCSAESWKRRLPITIWLPNYSGEYMLRDFIAGTTVALTSIPQGIAYAMIAGVPPQVGLYSSIFPGIVYALFGSCKVVTVGPTAILATLLTKYVAYSVDFAYLAAFLSGCVILLLGVLQLGFLLDFISKPVISGFTTAAALQIAATQLKALFHIEGLSGGTFISAIINFFKNITTVQLWDTVLGVFSILTLVSIKALPWRARGMLHVHVVRARNAIVVLVATVVAYVLYVKGITPFALTGTIEGGLPHFGPPPFTTTVNNQTLGFQQMLEVFNAEGLVMPLVAVLESIAIARAFAGSTRVDSTQEMLALGACNILASFAQCMPATGSFTRTALNHSSGVATQAGSLVKASVVLLAVTLLTRAFYFIPRASLAGVIIVAMASIIEVKVAKLLWRNSKTEFAVWLITVIIGTSVGLEYGILGGATSDAVRVLAHTAVSPTLHTHSFKVGNIDCVSVTLAETLSYASAARVSRSIRRCIAKDTSVVILDARLLHCMHFGVAESIIFTIQEQEREKNIHFLLWNLPEHCQRLLEDLHPGLRGKYVNGPSIDQFVLGLDMTPIENIPVY